MVQKPIKFNLLLDGRFISSLDELRAHFSSTVVDLFRQGLLTKWLYHRDRDAFDTLSTLSPERPDREIFWTIARLLKVQPAEMALGGSTVSTLDELTDNFSVDIVDRFRSGELIAFLDRIGEAQLAKTLVGLDATLRHIDLFEALCRHFNVEFDRDIASMMLSQIGKSPDEAPVVERPATSMEGTSSEAISEDEARTLVRNALSRELVVMSESLTESVAETLIRHQGRLDPELAADPSIESRFPLKLTFANLCYLRPEIARILAKFPGLLDFPSLTDLSFESARFLARRTGGLRFGSLTRLPFEVVSVLVDEQLFRIYPHRLDLPALEMLDLATARLLIEFKGELGLGVMTLAPEVFELLARRKAKTVFWRLIDYPDSIVETWHLPDCPLYFPALADFDRLTPAEAKHLAAKTPATGRAAYPESLVLKVTELDYKTAAELAGYGDAIVFARLETITPDVARALSRHRFRLRDNFYQVPMGSWLSFPALTNLSRECLNYLTAGQIHARLAFDGLRQMDSNLAKEVGGMTQSCLQLDGLGRIDPAIAAQLGSLVDVELHLDGLESIDLPTAQAFCQPSGFLCLFMGSIASMDPAVQDVFRVHFPGIVAAKGFQCYPNRARQRSFNLLYPAYSGVQPLIDPAEETMR